MHAHTCSARGLLHQATVQQAHRTRCEIPASPRPTAVSRLKIAIIENRLCCESPSFIPQRAHTVMIFLRTAELALHDRPDIGWQIFFYRELINANR